MTTVQDGGLDTRIKSKVTLTNPSFIIEVLSEGTETRDRVQKFEAYRSIPSFNEYLLVTQNQATIEGFYKNETGNWIIREPITGLDQHFNFHNFDLKLDLKTVFDQVDFN